MGKFMISCNIDSIPYNAAYSNARNVRSFNLESLIFRAVISRHYYLQWTWLSIDDWLFARTVLRFLVRFSYKSSLGDRLKRWRDFRNANLQTCVTTTQGDKSWVNLRWFAEYTELIRWRYDRCSHSIGILKVGSICILFEYSLHPYVCM